MPGCRGLNKNLLAYVTTFKKMGDSRETCIYIDRGDFIVLPDLDLLLPPVLRFLRVAMAEASLVFSVMHIM